MLEDVCRCVALDELNGHLNKFENVYDVVVECTGSPSGFSTALKAVVPLGAIVLKSTYSGDAHINLSPLVVKEVKLLGSYVSHLLFISDDYYCISER